MDNNLIISVYNTLDDKSAYHSDLFDLFGSPDGYLPGYIGTKQKGKFRSIRWDWNENGINKVLKYIYLIELKKDISYFNDWCKKEKSNGFQETKQKLKNILYVFKYKRKKIPAFIASVENIERIGRRMWLTYTPKRFFLLPPEFMEGWREELTNSSGYEDAAKMKNYVNTSLSNLEEICKSASTLDMYHIVPRSLIDKWLNDYITSGGKPLFLTDVVDNKTLAKKNLQTNNQVFWSIFSQYIGRTQVKANFVIKYRGKSYEITDVKVNSVIDNGLVFCHEAGVPKVIYEAMKVVFEDDFIDREFSTSSEKSINESLFLKRARKVKDVAVNCNKLYKETDYDYVLDLSPLGIDKKIVFDLTCGLWNKGIGKNKDEYVDQWNHNIFEVPEKNDSIISIWHYGLKTKIEEYKSNEVSSYLRKSHTLTSYIVNKGSSLHSIDYNKIRTYAIPFYVGESDYFDFKKEFNGLEPLKGDSTKTVLFTVLRSLLKTLKTHKSS